jgi:hypothetical protein
MLRAVLAAFAALAMSACSYGSMVDMAPYKARISKPAVAPGDYCEVDGKAAPFTVISHEDCAPVTWDQKTRTYTLVDVEDPESSVTSAVISLGSGLYAGQVEVRAEDDDADQPDRYQLFLFLARGNAFTMIPPLDDEPLKKLAAEHTRIVFREDARERLYIVSGANDRIKAFLRDAAREGLRIQKAEGDDVSVGVLDKAGAPDHEANKVQQRDIEAVLNLARAMTPK